MPEPFISSALGLDLSPRFAESTVVVASPTDATETIIASLTIPGDPAIASGIWLCGSAAWTVGTSGTASNLRLRQTNVSGTVIATTGAVTTAAASLRFHSLYGIDTAAVLPGQVYVLTLQVTSAAAASTVSSLFLGAIIV